MSLRYLVIDGTDGAGKSPFIDSLIGKLETEISVQMAQVFKYEELYSYWQTDPNYAISKLNNYIELEKKKAVENGIDLLLFDRHWPTVYVTVENQNIRQQINPSHRTLLLINSIEHLKNTRYYNILKEENQLPDWIYDEAQVKFQQEYRQIVDIGVENIYPYISDGRFDLDDLASDVIDKFRLGEKNNSLKQETIITVGPPGVGKTSWAYRQLDYEVISIDSIRYLIKGKINGGGNYYDIAVDNWKKEKNYSNNIILEGTFTEYEYLMGVIDLIRSEGIDVKVLVSNLQNWLEHYHNTILSRNKKIPSKEIELVQYEMFMKKFLTGRGEIDEKYNISSGDYFEKGSNNYGDLSIQLTDFFTS